MSGGELSGGEMSGGEVSRGGNVLHSVSYSPCISIVIMAVSVAVCDLENRVRVRLRSLEITPFDRSYTSSYSLSTVTMALAYILYRLRDIATY